MGPRPVDFDEEVIRQSPTFIKWMELPEGQRLRYACREFLKGHGDDEERLMRRIMIARRNNIRDHETLKTARRQSEITATITTTAAPTTVEQSSDNNTNNDSNDDNKKSSKKPKTRGRPWTSFHTELQVQEEMDAQAVEATRSYRTWAAMKDGQEFVVRGLWHVACV
jgi:hypothetical protein